MWEKLIEYHGKRYIGKYGLTCTSLNAVGAKSSSL